jgi:protoporphyrinogen oxidase
VTDSQLQPRYFQRPESVTDRVLDELIVSKFLKRRADVECVKVNAIADTYPLYHRGYLSRFAEANAAVQQFSTRIHLLGRSGAFWYNNADHSMRFAIELSRELLGYSESGHFNYRKYFGGIHGQSTQQAS